MIKVTIKKQIRHLLFLLSILVCVMQTNFCFCPNMTCVKAGILQESLTENKQPDDTEQENNQTEEAQQQSAEGETVSLQSNQLTLESPSALLMEASTGQVIYEKDPDTRRSPASITKIMTMLLIFENLEQGKISLQDEVVTSAYAKSMGGSQVFLEEGEIQTVDTLIKCIAVASGNDASVAMAEKIAGSEEAFVQMMNEKAEKLGMKNTHFEDCCGLTSSENHYTTARDIAIMAKALIQNYPKVYDYTTIWMEDIVHETKKGSKNFTLSSTNKLIKQYPYTTGLKTGSTSIAKYCFCATARKNDIDLIAVVMAAPDHKVRFDDAKKMLEYGFSLSRIYKDDEIAKVTVRVSGGKEEQVEAVNEKEFCYLDLTGADLSKIEKKVVYDEKMQAPIEKGAKAGSVDYYLNGNKIGDVKLIVTNGVEKATYRDVFLKVFRKMLL